MFTILSLAVYNKIIDPSIIATSTFTFLSSFFSSFFSGDGNDDANGGVGDSNTTIINTKGDDIKLSDNRTIKDPLITFDPIKNFPDTSPNPTSDPVKVLNVNDSKQNAVFYTNETDDRAAAYQKRLAEILNKNK